MRALLLTLCLVGTAFAETPWQTLLDARKSFVEPVHPASAASGRHKPDDVGIYDLQRLEVRFSVPESGLPQALAFEVLLEAQMDLDDRLPLLLLHSEALAVSSEAGVELPFEQIPDTGELLIDLPAPVAAGTPLRLRIEARLDYDCAGGPSCSEDGAYTHLAEAGWYPMSLEYPASDRFSLRLDVTSRGPRYPSSIGGLETDDTGQGVREWRYRSETPLSAIALALVPDEPVIEADDPVQLFGPDPHPPLRLLLERIAERYEALFGPYPYSRIAITAIPDDARSAIGPQANLLIPLSLWHPPDSLEDETLQREVISHEFGHQYFFNLVGITEPAEAWLSEGFAEYASTQFSLGQTGTDAHLARNYWGYLTAVAPGADAPLFGLEVRRGPHFFEIVYLKGSVVLWMLRDTLAPGVFDEALRDYVAAFAGEIATTAEFIGHLDAYTDVDLDPFFDRWLFRGGHPRLRVSTSRVGASRELVNLSIEDDTAPPFTGALPVLVHGPERAEWIEVDIGGAREVRLGEGGWLDVDPNRTWLRRIRPEPAGDVNLDGVVDGKDLLDVLAAQGRALPGPDWRDALDVVRDDRIDPADSRAVVDTYGEGD